MKPKITPTRATATASSKRSSPFWPMPACALPVSTSKKVLVIALCDVLNYLHRQRPAPIICRDLNPRNVMVGPAGKVRLVDLGIAEPYQAGREQTVIGTAGYASPEQYFGYSDARSDIYGLGATLHHLLTRRDPRREKLFSFHDAPPRSLNPAISEALEAVILKAAEHNPEDRYQSMAEMKAALLACL